MNQTTLTRLKKYIYIYTGAGEEPLSNKSWFLSDKYDNDEPEELDSW